MAHPLTKLDLAAEAVVKSEIATPSILTTEQAKAVVAGQKTIAGFVVYDKGAVAEARTKTLETRRLSAETYKSDKSVLQQKLEELDVVPLGYAPAAAWDFICRESGLYRLKFDYGGKTKMNRFVNAGKGYGWKCFGVFSAIAIVLLLFSYFVVSVMLVTFPNVTDRFILAVYIVPLALHCIVSFIYDGSYNVLIAKVLNKYFIRKQLIAMSHDEILKKLMPKGVASSFSDHFLASIALPEPPAKVHAQLLKLQNLSGLEVVAEPDAISFVPPVDRQILDDMDAQYEEIAEEARLRAAEEPIITVRHGSAVALVAQFGEFAIEQEIMDRAITTEHIL